MAKDVIKILQEVRGTGQPEAAYTDGIYWDLTINPTNTDGTTRLAPGIYNSILKVNETANKVSDITVEIEAVAAIKDAVTSVYNDKVTLDSLYGDKTTLDSLYADKLKLDSTYDRLPAIDSLYADKATLDSIFADKATLDSLVNDKATLDSLYADKAKLDSVFNDRSAITTVADDLQLGYSFIEDYGNITDNVESGTIGSSSIVNTGSHIEDIQTVGSKITDVTTVASSITAVETNATNIVDIQNASGNAAIASDKAVIATTKASEASVSEINADLSRLTAEAHKLTADSYATEPEDVYVKVYTVDNGEIVSTDTDEYSSFHWKCKAQAIVTDDALLVANNLDDLDDVAVARTNLGVDAIFNDINDRVNALPTKAVEMAYNNETSGSSAENVKDAIDEALNLDLGGLD